MATVYASTIRMTSAENTLSDYYLSIPVRYADTDAQTHVFFGNYFTYMDEAYMGYLEAIGFSWAALADMDLETYYVSADCQFMGRAYYGDMLHVYAGCTRLGNSSLEVEMSVINSGSIELIAKGRMIAVMIDSTSDKAVRIPDAFREAVNTFQS